MTNIERDLKVGLSEGHHDPGAPVLVLTVGLPRSGKTTWARQQDVPIVSPDYMRLAMHGKPYLEEAEPWVWVQTKTMIKALFLAGHFVVILDSNNGTRKRRADWNNPLWQVIYKIIPAGPEECIARAKKSFRSDLIPVIQKMFRNWEPIHPDEGPLLSEFTQL